MLVLGTALMLMVSCADEDLKPIITFDDATKGAYVRLVDETDKLLNLFDIPGSAYTYSVEFVDLEGGTLVSEYVVDLVYVDNDPDNGDNSTGPIEFRRFSQADFETNAAGLRSLSNITITGPEAIAAAGTTADLVSPGDQFQFKGRVTTPDGTWGASNSSATVNGSAFQGHFDFTMPAGCPSDLSGTYNYTTTDIWCGNADVSGTVEVTNNGGGTHEFSDWSFGAYESCYGAGNIATSLTFQEVCSKVSFTGFVNQFGDTYELSSTVDGENWIITWSNDFGEAGVTTVVFPGGVPFTVD